MTVFQQGDVVFITTKIPKTKLTTITDPVIQHGEATGHAHRVVMFKHDDRRSSPNWQISIDEDSKLRYLKVTDEPIHIDHEEHNRVSLPPGEYEIRIVREYDHFLEEAREVVD